MGRMSPGSWISFLPIGLALVASYIGGLFGAWAWAITVLGVAFTMRRSNGPVIPAPVPPSRIVIGAIVSFVLGAGIRLWQLDKFPPFFFDEAVLAYDARCVLGGRPLEPMDVSYFYRSPVWLAVSSAAASVLGHSIFSLRLFSVLLGSVTCMATFIIGARLWNPTAGLIAAVWMIAHPWPLHLSRLYVFAVMVPLLGLILVLVGTRRKWRWYTRASLAGMVAVLGIYGYAAALHLVFLAFAIPFCMEKPNEERWKEASLACGIIAVLSAPALGWGWLAGYRNHIMMTGIIGDLYGFLSNACLLASHLRSESVPAIQGLFPSTPGLIPALLAPVFLLGCASAIRSASPADRLVLVWFCIALLPALLSKDGMRFPGRLSGTFVPVALLCARGSLYILGNMRRRLGVAAVLSLWIGGLGGGLYTYFGTYLHDPVVRTAFREYDLTIGEDLKAMAQERPLVFGSPIPLTRFPVEKYMLFDDMTAGRISEGIQACDSPELLKLYRDACGRPAVFLLLSRHGRRRDLFLTTYEDVGVQADKLILAGRYGEAAAKYRQACRWAADSPLLWTRLGYALLLDGKVRGSLKAFNKAIGLGAAGADAYSGCARAQLKLHNRQEAIRILQQGLISWPNDKELVKDLLQTMEVSGK